MGAQVGQGAEFSLLVAQQQHRLVADDEGKLVAAPADGVLGGDEHPVSVPDAGHLGRVDSRIAVEVVGKRVLWIESHCWSGHGTSLARMPYIANGR